MLTLKSILKIMSEQEEVEQGIVSILQSYVKAKDKLEECKQDILKFFGNKNMRTSENLSEFKFYLRVAMGHENEWLAAETLRNIERSPAQEEIWQSRERIRLKINRKSRQIIKEVFGYLVTVKDEETVILTRSPGISVAISPPSSPTHSVEEVILRPRSSRVTMTPVQAPRIYDTHSDEQVTTVDPPSSSKKRKHSAFDGLLVLSDFRAVSKERKHKSLLRGLQEHANAMSRILEELGNSHQEWFIDGFDSKNVQTRWLALKPGYIENIKFRKYLPLNR